MVIKNTIPDTWDGRKFNVDLFRDDKLFLTSTEVHVGDQVDFLIKPVLFFAVSHQYAIGEVFNSTEVMSYVHKYDLSKYPEGMEVTLTQQAGGGKFEFSAIHKTLKHLPSYSV